MAEDRPALLLELYVGRERLVGVAAEQRLRALLRDRLRPEQYRLTVIDIFDNPAAAEAADCVAVPTLIRREPAPPRRLVGDLSDLELVVAALGLPREPLPEQA